MTAHIFENSLNYEQSQFVEQDKFYKEQLNAAMIKRFDFNDPEEKEFQKEDIDLQLTFDDGRDSIYVSEKHRKAKYNDILLETYSKYPHEFGWLKKCRADYLAYFMNDKVYWIKERTLKEFCINNLKGKITSKDFDLTYLGKKSTSVSKTINIQGKMEKLWLIQAYNRSGGSEWFTESMAIPIDCLKRCGVEIEEYKL